MPAEITPELMRVIWGVVRRYPELPCLGWDDMVSAALEKLLRSAHRYRAFEPGLVATITKRSIVDEMRRLHIIERHSRQMQVIVSMDAPTWTGDERDRHEKLGKDDPDPLVVEEMLGQLTEKERYIANRLVQGYKAKEIGEELGVSESRICQHLIRIRRRLEQWDLDGEGDPGLAGG